MTEINDRTTALGLFNYSESYRRSAEKLREYPADFTHPNDPIRFLYWHAIELALKAYLRNSDFTVEDLKKVGHNCKKLYKKANKNGGLDLPMISELTDRWGPMHVLGHRYIETGYVEMPLMDDLAKASRLLNSSVAETLDGVPSWVIEEIV